MTLLHMTKGLFTPGNNCLALPGLFWFVLACPWIVRGLSVCAGLSVVCPWFVCGLSLVCPWFVSFCPGLCGKSCFVPFFLVCSGLPGLSLFVLVCPGFVCGLSNFVLVCAVCPGLSRFFVVCFSLPSLSLFVLVCPGFVCGLSHFVLVCAVCPGLSLFCGLF